MIRLPPRPRCLLRRALPWVLLSLVAGPAAAAGTPLPGPPGDPDWHIPLAPDPGEPATADYRRLTEALAHYRTLAARGGWPPLPDDLAPAPGQRDSRVPLLRDRLRISGDYTDEALADAWFYDGGIARALARFQRRHGLPETGTLDARTRAELNVPVADRLAQIEATRQRWRWLPRDPGPRYLWANVAAGSLSMVENGNERLAMRIIAGHPTRATPSFASEVREVIFNPTWYVPRTIAVEDLLPSQQEDPTLFRRLGIRVFSGLNEQSREVDQARINWDAVDPVSFPYRLQQDPGPTNGLGRIKLNLDNPFDIYLHDTPARRLFDLNSRTLSSGCLRLEKPEALVDLLLADDRGLGQRPGSWQPADTEAALAAGTTRTVALSRPVPVFIVYLTAWVTEDGQVHFRPDVYSRDARLAAAGAPDSRGGPGLQ